MPALLLPPLAQPSRFSTLQDRERPSRGAQPRTAALARRATQGATGGQLAHRTAQQVLGSLYKPPGRCLTAAPGLARAAALGPPAAPLVVHMAAVAGMGASEDPAPPGVATPAAAAATAAEPACLTCWCTMPASSAAPPCAQAGLYHSQLTPRQQ